MRWRFWWLWWFTMFFSSGIADGTSTTRFPMTDRFTGFSPSFAATVGFLSYRISFVVLQNILHIIWPIIEYSGIFSIIPEWQFLLYKTNSFNVKSQLTNDCNNSSLHTMDIIGSCDPQNRLKSPYRISPRNPSPPKVYRKKVISIITFSIIVGMVIQ